MADTSAKPDTIKAHAATYAGVVGLIKWGTVASVAVTALVIWLIA